MSRAVRLLMAMVAAAAPAWAQQGRLPGATGAMDGPWRGQIHLVPVVHQDGATRLIETRFCRPLGEAPARLVLLNHGSPWRAETRQRMTPWLCRHEAAAWFLRRGYVVGIPARRGFGGSDGPFEEGFGPCRAPDFLRAGRAVAQDILAALSYARGLPFVASEGAAVIGQSVGGWGAVALASRNPDGVALVVNMAGGGYGGADAARAGCRTDGLEPAAGAFGATARVPSLWVYTANDSFFGPDLAARMHRAYTGAGGVAELRQLPPFSQDGHALFIAAGGSAVWGPVVAPMLLRFAPARAGGRTP